MRSLQTEKLLINERAKKGGLFKGPPNMDFGLLLSDCIFRYN